MLQNGDSVNLLGERLVGSVKDFRIVGKQHQDSRWLNVMEVAVLDNRPVMNIKVAVVLHALAAVDPVLVKQVHVSGRQIRSLEPLEVIQALGNPANSECLSR